MKMNPETKNIIDMIVNKILKVINLEPFRDKISNFITSQYHKGLEAAEVKFNMNFVSNDTEIKFLNNYVFDNLEAATDEIGNNLRGELSRGIMNKESVSQLKKRVKTVFKDSKYNNRMKMVLRTEKLRANNAGQLDGAVQSNLKLKKYLDVIMDNRTSPICKAENKKYGEKSQAISLDKEFIVKVKNKTYSAQAPPFHPNCRSTLRFVREDNVE